MAYGCPRTLFRIEHNCLYNRKARLDQMRGLASKIRFMTLFYRPVSYVLGESPSFQDANHAPQCAVSRLISSRYNSWFSSQCPISSNGPQAKLFFGEINSTYQCIYPVDEVKTQLISLTAYCSITVLSMHTQSHNHEEKKSRRFIKRHEIEIITRRCFFCCQESTFLS